jgi:undecaprenyl phosphate N,N'-diacetylbacillosamine 1-phosphate transferase
MYKFFFKPFIDYFFSFLILIILSPVIFLIIVFLLFVNSGKVFFYQKRPGLKTKPFYIIKFRTMREAYDVNNVLLPDHLRVTIIGKIIRSWSIDELLQLINVLKGDMSLIGPRPLLMSYLPMYSSIQARRHDVKPGITGWAQINGRNSISWEERFELDVEYVDNISFLNDMKILGLTLIKVISRKGVNANGDINMEGFQGNKSS